MKSTRKRWNRRRYVAGNQLHTLVVYLAYFFFVFVSCGAMIFIPISTRMQNLPADSREKYELSKLFLQYHRDIWPAFLAICALVTAHWIVVSHRIWGPLERFRGVFEAASRGELPANFGVRKNDHFQREAKLLETMFRNLRSSIGEAKAHCREAKRLCDDARTAREREAPRLPMQALEDLTLKLGELEAKLLVFKTDEPSTIQAQPKVPALDRVV